MTIQRKSLAITLDPNEEGAFRATFATFNEVDHDGDVTLPGAFPIGKSVLVSAYMHTSWQGALPVGKGVIGADEKTAWVDGKFFLTTDHGKATYETVKEVGSDQQWSYGYETKDATVRPAELAKWPGASRVLKQQDVYEISPVLIGAGLSTRTEYIKALGIAGPLPLRVHSLHEQLKAATLAPETMAAIAQIDLLADELDELVDGLMDTLGIPDPDEAEEDAEETTEAKSLSFIDHSRHALVGVQTFVTRSKSLADLRAKKQQKDGRVLSSANRERLAALASGLTAAQKDIQELLDATDPAAGKAAETDVELAGIYLDVVRRNAALLTT